MLALPSLSFNWLRCWKSALIICSQSYFLLGWVPQSSGSKMLWLWMAEQKEELMELRSWKPSWKMLLIVSLLLYLFRSRLWLRINVSSSINPNYHFLCFWKYSKDFITSFSYFIIIIHLDGNRVNISQYMKPGETNRHGKRRLNVSEEDNCYKVILHKPYS